MASAPIASTPCLPRLLPIPIASHWRFHPYCIILWHIHSMFICMFNPLHSLHFCVHPLTSHFRPKCACGRPVFVDVKGRSFKYCNVVCRDNELPPFLTKPLGLISCSNFLLQILQGWDTNPQPQFTPEKYVASPKATRYQQSRYCLPLKRHPLCLDRTDDAAANRRPEPPTILHSLSRESAIVRFLCRTSGATIEYTIFDWFTSSLLLIKSRS